MSKRDLDIAALTPEERLSLLEQLWDSLAATPEAIPLTEAQRAELDAAWTIWNARAQSASPGTRSLAEFVAALGEASRRPAGGCR